MSSDSIVKAVTSVESLELEEEDELSVDSVSDVVVAVDEDELDDEPDDEPDEELPEDDPLLDDPELLPPEVLPDVVLPEPVVLLPDPLVEVSVVSSEDEEVDSVSVSSAVGSAVSVNVSVPSVSRSGSLDAIV